MVAPRTAEITLQPSQIWTASQKVRLSGCDSIKLRQIRGAVEAAAKIKRKYRHVAYVPIKASPPVKGLPGRRPRSFTPNETKSLIADYRAGVTVKAISEKFRCSRSNVQRILQVNDIPRRTPNLTEARVTALRKRRSEGATYAQLVREFNVSRRTISKYTAP